MTATVCPFKQSCCEHHCVAALHWNEQTVLTAMNFFSKAQAPGGNGFALASATEKLAGSATTPANKATFTSDAIRMRVPHSLQKNILQGRRACASYCHELPRPRGVSTTPEPKALRGAHYFPSRQMPSASCAGRSEIENSTDCFAAA